MTWLRRLWRWLSEPVPVYLTHEEWRTVRQGLAYARISVMADTGCKRPQDTRIEDWNRLDLSIARQVGEWR